jgi:hypothetical protein
MRDDECRKPQISKWFWGAATSSQSFEDKLDMVNFEVDNSIPVVCRKLKLFLTYRIFDELFGHFLEISVATFYYTKN